MAMARVVFQCMLEAYPVLSSLRVYSLYRLGGACLKLVGLELEVGGALLGAVESAAASGDVGVGCVDTDAVARLLAKAELAGG